MLTVNWLHYVPIQYHSVTSNSKYCSPNCLCDPAVVLLLQLLLQWLPLLLLAVAQLHFFQHCWHPQLLLGCILDQHCNNIVLHLSLARVGKGCQSHHTKQQYNTYLEGIVLSTRRDKTKQTLHFQIWCDESLHVVNAHPWKEVHSHELIHVRAVGNAAEMHAHKTDKKMVWHLKSKNYPF